MFSRIFIEKDILDYPQAKNILSKFPEIPKMEIERVDEIFGRVKKPYLQKREDLQLFLGKKRGELIKEAPEAYGLAGDPHYYFVHAYNCIYECEYCYLQGYFNSPDIVLFLNHEDIKKEMLKICSQYSEEKTVWFHAGEFSDSLALSHLTDELPFYFETFSNLKNAKLELRTKSANIKNLLRCTPLKNVIVSFSLSPQNRIKKTDLKTPSLKGRLSAMSTLQKRGFSLGVHLDPVIHEENFEEAYINLFKELSTSVDVKKIEYISIGVVRFTSQVFHQVKKNYPNSELLAAEFQKGKDGKIRYPRPFRLWILDKIKNIAIKSGLVEKQIYLCME